MAKPNVFIIGAGIAGLACARELVSAGFDPRIVDKGRGPGGRCSSRRSAFGRFDHGASFFTARDPGFVRQVEHWRDEGVVAPWDGRFEGRSGDDTWWVGTPAMNAMVRYEAEAVDAEFGLEIAQPQPGRDCRFDLRTKTGDLIGEADFVVFAAPAPQTAVLLPEGSSLVPAARSSDMAPCWTLMASFPPEAADPGFDALMPEDDVLDAVFLQAGKPGREPGMRIVAHANPYWSEEHLEEPKERVVNALLAALHRHLPGQSTPTHLDAHRWRYARVTQPAEESFGLDRGEGVATCGDWHIAPRVESAWLSGHRLGRRMAEVL